MNVIHQGMQDKMSRVLRECHECYTLQDIVDLIRAGKMQSFVHGDSWAVTQVLDMPRRRVLELFMAVGHMQDMTALEHKVDDFAVETGATLIRAYGREGWSKVCGDYGWKSGPRIYTKEIG